MRIAIIGGGLSGLATAYCLHRLEAGHEVIVFEASPRWGGIVRTEHDGGFLLEGGPDAFLRHKPEALELCRELGLDNELIEMRPEHRQSHVWSEGRFYPLPKAFLKPPISLRELETSPLLSQAGRQRAALEPTIPPGNASDESVAQFFKRRFGREVALRIAEPLLAGVFGGDMRQISVRAAFPRLFEYERRHGCLATESPKQPEEEASPFLTLRTGMARLVEALRGNLSRSTAFRHSEPVGALWRIPQGYRLETPRGDEEFDAVAIAAQAPAASRLLQREFPRAARHLARIPHSPALLVVLGYSQDVLADVRGTGFIVPPSEGRLLLACTWVSHKWEGRCPPGGSMLRAYLAGEPAARMMEEDDGAILEAVRSELSEIMRVDAPPSPSRVYRLPQALPGYLLGHRERVRQLLEVVDSVPGLEIAGNYLDGVGLPDCIRHARRVAQSLLSPGSGVEC